MCRRRPPLEELPCSAGFRAAAPAAQHRLMCAGMLDKVGTVGPVTVRYGTVRYVLRPLVRTAGGLRAGGRLGRCAAAGDALARPPGRRPLELLAARVLDHAVSVLVDAAGGTGLARPAGRLELDRVQGRPQLQEAGVRLPLALHNTLPPGPRPFPAGAPRHSAHAQGGRDSRCVPHRTPDRRSAARRGAFGAEKGLRQGGVQLGGGCTGRLQVLESDLSGRALSCCAGLAPGQGEALAKVDSDWLVNGRFGVVQFADPQ